MLTRVKRLWELPESKTTKEDVFLNRRYFCKLIAASHALSQVAPMNIGATWAASSKRLTDDLYPVRRNDQYKMGTRALTEENLATSYNNYF